eukprot:3589401-Alexandrium_andersonii.AAC.1
MGEGAAATQGARPRRWWSPRKAHGSGNGRTSRQRTRRDGSCQGRALRGRVGRVGYVEVGWRGFGLARVE